MKSFISRAPVQRFLAILAVSLAFAHCLALCWSKWGELVVDYGRELELPDLILQGKVLYRDFRYYYGPFPPYFNALLFKIFGIHMNVLVAAGIVSAGLVTILLYRTARLFMTRLEAAAITIAFIYTCAFSKFSAFGVFNFITPYTYAIVYGLVAALGSLYFLLRNAVKGRGWDYVISCVFLILSAYCKVEIFFPAAVVHLLFPLFKYLAGTFRWKDLLPGFLSALFIAASYGVVSLLVGPGLYADNLAGPGLRGNGDYNYAVLGLTHVNASLKEGIASTLIFTVLGVLALALYRVGKNKDATMRRVTCGLALLAGLTTYFFVEVEYVFRFLPVVLCGAALVVVWNGFTRRAEWQKLTPMLLSLAFALCCAARILLRMSAHHVGFYLLPAGILALGIICFHGLRRFSEFKYATLGLLAAIAIGHYQNNWIGYHLKTVDFNTPRGNLKILEESSNGVPYGIEFVRLNQMLSAMPQGTSILVLPQGVAITFFSGQRHDFPMYTFLPMEFNARYEEENVLRMLNAKPPDVIVRLEFPMAEYGSQVFGVHYAQNIWGWMYGNYRLHEQLGYGFITVLVRKDKQFPKTY